MQLVYKFGNSTRENGNFEKSLVSLVGTPSLHNTGSQVVDKKLLYRRNLFKLVLL